MNKRTLQLIQFSIYSLLLFSCTFAPSKRNSKTAGNLTTSDTIMLSNDKMILVQSKAIHLGSKQGNFYNQPDFDTIVNSFYIDKNLVTVAEFENFVKSTGYITEAENFGDAGVYDVATGKWDLIKGASWRQPFGFGKQCADPNHPVTQVSWNDACAFAKWIGKRLPTEFEWECAARNGENTPLTYSWGNELAENGVYKANFWQGSQYNYHILDGYLYTSPVGIFGSNKIGLTDMGGNVWQWCSNSFKLYSGNNIPFQVNETIKAIRGGSFLYDETANESLSVYYRSFNSMETSLFNLGFRCAKNVELEN